MPMGRWNLLQPGGPPLANAGGRLGLDLDGRLPCPWCLGRDCIRCSLTLTDMISAGECAFSAPEVRSYRLLLHRFHGLVYRNTAIFTLLAYRLVRSSTIAQESQICRVDDFAVAVLCADRRQQPHDRDKGGFGDVGRPRRWTSDEASSARETLTHGRTHHPAARARCRWTGE